MRNNCYVSRDYTDDNDDKYKYNIMVHVVKSTMHDKARQAQHGRTKWRHTAQGLSPPHGNSRHLGLGTSRSMNMMSPALHICVLLLLLLLQLQPTHSFCPSKCQCLGGEVNSRALCVDAALEDVPIQLNPETRYINLTLNKIRNLEFTLPFYMKLEVLDLSQNIIETLGSKNFEYQTELRTLNLSHNSVSLLQKDAFKGLTNLLMLDLSNNRIDVVHPQALGDLTALVEFDLTNNFIVSLEENSFRNLMSLKLLIFKNNQLIDVPANNFEHLHALRTLDMSQNLIGFVRNDSFQGLRQLKKLTMRGNIISELDINAFDGLNALTHMDLADNNLTMVPTYELSKLSNLTYLSLSGNRFTQLSAVAFLNLFHLMELHLNRLIWLTRIDSRAFADNTHLQTLHMSNNPQFREMPMRLFQGNPNIVELFMQGNDLQTLHASQFPVEQLQRLYLGHNPLRCNCSLLWLWRLVTGNFNEQHQQRSNAAVSASAKNTPTYEKLGAQLAAYAAEDTDFEELLTDGTDEPVVSSSSMLNRATSGGSLKLDSELIGCDIWQDRVRVRRLLASMSEGEITCPAHLITIICGVMTVLLVALTAASIVYYLRFAKRRRKLMHERNMRSGKSIVNVHDRILQHQPLSTAFAGAMMGGPLAMGSANGALVDLSGTIGGYPHMLPGQQIMQQMLQPLHGNDYQQTLPQVDKLELERYLTAQAIANEYRALKPWELPVKEATNNYTDEPEHLYEKFDHYEYPDTVSTGGKSQRFGSHDGGTTQHDDGSGTGKPHVVYV